MLTLEGSEIKFADFLREILLAITLEPFTQSECSFHQMNHIFSQAENVFSVDSRHTNPMLFSSISTWYEMSACAGGVKLSCTNFGRHSFRVSLLINDG